MPAPSTTDVTTYLTAQGADPAPADVADAYKAEKAAQARVCRVPADADPWPDDLAEALKRRVARNLAMRNVPLGVQSAISEGGVSTIRIGSDPEVRRLEAPFRKVPLG